MLDRELFNQLQPLLHRAGGPDAAPGMPGVSDAERDAAIAAVEAILAGRGMTVDMLAAEMAAIAAPAEARLRHLPHLKSPPELRPGGEWRPLLLPDDTVAYTTLFPTGATGHVQPVLRDGKQAWLGVYDDRLLRTVRGDIQFGCVEGAIHLVERVAQYMAREQAQAHPLPRNVFRFPSKPNREPVDE